MEVIAIDKYNNAPAMQVADDSYVIDMSNKNILKNIIRKIKNYQYKITNIINLKPLTLKTQKVSLNVMFNK